LQVVRGPVHDLGVEDVPGGLHLRVGGVDRDLPVAAGVGLVGEDVPAGLVDVDADKVEGRTDYPKVVVGEGRRVGTGLVQIAI
jgi:hypothetical protein